MDLNSIDSTLTISNHLAIYYLISVDLNLTIYYYR